MSTMIRWSQRYLRPHQYAVTLMDAQLDALREGRALSESDAAWLDAHLERCEDCRTLFKARQASVSWLRQENPLLAPEGFHARVVQAALSQERSERADAPHQTVQAQGRTPPVKGWMARVSSLWSPEQFRPNWGWSAVATGIVAIVLFVGIGPGALVTPSHQIAVSGTGQVAHTTPADLRVHASHIGAAQVRSEVTRIAKTHGLAWVVTDHAVRLRIPRAKLVTVLKALAQRGPYTVESQTEGIPSPERTEVVVDVEFEN